MFSNWFSNRTTEPMNTAALSTGPTTLVPACLNYPLDILDTEEN